MGTGKLSGKPDEMRGGNLAMELASHPLMILSTQEYKMGTGKLSGKPDEMRGGNLAMELAPHPEGRGGGAHAFNDSLHPEV